MQESSAQTKLDELLIPGTDPDVAAWYHSLRDSADKGSFALFEEPIIVCDTETTGLDARSCSLIEIAAVRLEGADEVGVFQTLVNPGHPIPAEITEITGITDADVAGAPSPEEAAAAFAHFAAHDALVAHNAPFDRAFIMQHAEPGAFAGTWIDTLPLAQMLLPRLGSHRLGDLAQAFGLVAATHRALDDVRSLAQLWRILVAAAHTLAPGLAQLIANISPQTDWDLRPFFQHAADASPSNDLQLRELRSERVSGQFLPTKEDAAEVPLRFVDDAVVEHAFTESGIAGAMYPGYERREPQLQMALEVNAALRERGYRALEAGTGVGKSMAYLVPLALTAKENAISLGVATKTNALMDQLVYHELPRLARAVGGLEYVALKGYEHYPCLRKVEQLVQHGVDEDVAVIQMLATLAAFTAQTTWGDLDALNFHWPRALRTRIQANADDCLKKRCRFFRGRHCYLHGARNHACSADIVVTNHALLFRDAQLDNGILPPVHHWVIDEAHAAESEARKQMSHSISARELNAALLRLTSTRSGLLAMVRKKAAETDGGTMLYGGTADADDRATQITAVATSFFAYVKDLAEETDDNGGYDRMTLWVSPQLRESNAWALVARQGASLVEKLDGLIRRISTIISTTEQFEGTFASQQADLSSLSCSLKDMQTALELVLDGSDGAYVYSVELDRNPDKVAEALYAQRLDIGEALVDGFYGNVMSAVYTSATLATGNAERPFAHFMHATGLDRVPPERVGCRQIASSYDFDGHMGVLLPQGMPAPAQPGYRKALAELLYQVHTNMGGSVLTLFTNRREMEALYHLLKPQLSEHGIELTAQLRGTNAKSLRDRFLEDETLSLFALKSFWEGFDAPGDALRCVVIPKLPFGKPSDPLSREREVREGRAAWGRYSLPEAVVELKQAAGRLIRRSDDEGWLVLADSRLQTKNYGKVFLNAMPTSDVRVLPLDELAKVLREEHRSNRG